MLDSFPVLSVKTNFTYNLDALGKTGLILGESGLTICSIGKKKRSGEHRIEKT